MTTNYLLLAYLACALTCGYASLCRVSYFCPPVRALITATIVGLFWPIVVLVRFFALILS